MDEAPLRRLMEEEQERIGEDEESRTQCLQILRSWIENNPNIPKIRTDDSFLLGFLRTKKFNVDDAKQMICNFLTCCQTLSPLTSNLDVCDPVIDSILRTRTVYTSPFRDDGGRTVFICRYANLDPYTTKYVDFGRMFFSIIFSVMDDPTTQVMGCVFVGDLGNVLPAHVTFWPLWEMLRFMKAFFKSLPIRHKEIHIINLNSIIKVLFYMLRAILPKKIKDRITIHNSLEDLHSRVSPSVLPEEYGGSVPAEEMCRLFAEKARASRDLILSMSDLHMTTKIGKREEAIDKLF